MKDVTHLMSIHHRENSVIGLATRLAILYGNG
jgi:hypothetical protein